MWNLVQGSPAEVRVSGKSSSVWPTPARRELRRCPYWNTFPRMRQNTSLMIVHSWPEMSQAVHFFSLWELYASCAKCVAQLFAESCCYFFKLFKRECFWWSKMCSQRLKFNIILIEILFGCDDYNVKSHSLISKFTQMCLIILIF